MRSVYKTRNKINFKDFLRAIVIFLLNYIAMFIYATTILSINYLTSGGNWMISNFIKNGYLIYAIFIGPSLNSLAHLIYTEFGNLHYKAFIWLHSLSIAIMIPLAIFL